MVINNVILLIQLFSEDYNLGLCRPSFTCQCVCTCVCTHLPDVITVTKINVIHS